MKLEVESHISYDEAEYEVDVDSAEGTEKLLIECFRNDAGREPTPEERAALRLKFESGADVDRTKSLRSQFPDGGAPGQLAFFLAPAEKDNNNE